MRRDSSTTWRTSPETLAPPPEALSQIGEYDKLSKLAPGKPKVAVKEEDRKFRPSSGKKEEKAVTESARMRAFAESKKAGAAKPAAEGKKKKEPAAAKKKEPAAAKKKAAPAAKTKKSKAKAKADDSPGSPVPGVLLVAAIGAGASAPLHIPLRFDSEVLAGAAPRPCTPPWRQQTLI